MRDVRTARNVTDTCHSTYNASAPRRAVLRRDAQSTVVGLIERYYDPAAGRVTLDGADLGSLNLTWLRQQVGARRASARLQHPSGNTNRLCKPTPVIQT